MDIFKESAKIILIWMEIISSNQEAWISFHWLQLVVAFFIVLGWDWKDKQS